MCRAMKIFANWVALACGLAAVGSPATAAEPRNLALLKEEIRAYVRSGEYDRDIAAVSAKAGEWIETRVKEGREGKEGGGKPAVVFDLDETLISNWPEMERESFGFSREAFDAWTESAQCPAIESVRAVYRRTRELGVAVIYITGRPERFRAATQKNLEAVGCADYAEFICRPNDSKETSAACKSAARAKLEAAGYVIIANIGDQESDLAGGHAEKTFKLPNPVYLSK